MHAILRTSWVVSAHGNNFIKTMRRLSEIKDQINVVDDQIGGPTCARDIAQTCISIAGQLIQDPANRVSITTAVSPMSVGVGLPILYI